MQISNNKPADISPIYAQKFKGDFNTEMSESIKDTIIRPLLTPLVAGQNVTVSANGHAYDEDDIMQEILNCFGNVANPSAEQNTMDFFENGLVHFDKKARNNMFVNDLFAIQAAAKEGLPMPSPLCVYVPATDIAVPAREFLAGQANIEKFFVGLSFYARPDALGFYFANDVAFTAFKTWLANEVAMLSSSLPNETNQLFSDFQTLTLSDLTESLILRNSDGDNNTDFSFARMLVNYLMKYTNTAGTSEFGVLPFAVSELYCPRTVIFVNIQKHSLASPKQIANEWDLIKKSLSMNLKLISNNKLNKLTATQRMLQHVAGAAAQAQAQQNMAATRCKRAKFRKTAPSGNDLAKNFSKIINKMAFVAKSENAIKNTRISFSRANRREPDNFNRPGRLISTKYKPDIHIYLDTSGSIDEMNYQATIKGLIKMAKKMNVNLYFNSFSHTLSQCTKLNTKDKSMNQIYAEFQKIPKVTGGTNYEQIWHYINQNKKRIREMSVLITDFEYYPPNHYVKHPKNLYYVPMLNMNWQRICREAEDFIKNMSKIDPYLRRKILF